MEKSLGHGKGSRSDSPEETLAQKQNAGPGGVGRSEEGKRRWAGQRLCSCANTPAGFSCGKTKTEIWPQAPAGKRPGPGRLWAGCGSAPSTPAPSAPGRQILSGRLHPGSRPGVPSASIRVVTSAKPAARSYCRRSSGSWVGAAETRGPPGAPAGGDVRVPGCARASAVLSHTRAPQAGAGATGAGSTLARIRGNVHGEPRLHCFYPSVGVQHREDSGRRRHFFSHLVLAASRARARPCEVQVEFEGAQGGGTPRTAIIFWQHLRSFPPEV